MDKKHKNRQKHLDEKKAHSTKTHTKKKQSQEGEDSPSIHTSREAHFFLAFFAGPKTGFISRRGAVEDAPDSIREFRA